MRSTSLKTTSAARSRSTRGSFVRGSAIAAASLLLIAGCGSAESEEGASSPVAEEPSAGEQPTGDQTAGSGAVTANITNADGEDLGTVTFAETDAGYDVSAELSGLEPGFYGFHVHETGLCEPDSAAPDDPEDTGAFLSAGSHINTDDSEHPQHAGDLPVLLVSEAGEARMSVQTDRLNPDVLLDDDGSAVMIHSEPDNYANVPDRYADGGADEDSRSTGDAGDRLACGVVEG